MIPLGILASAGAAPVPSMELIQTVITSTPTVVNFNSIPQTFRHLQLRISTALVQNNLNSIMLRINGGTDGYGWASVTASGSAVSSGGAPNQTSIVFGPHGNTATEWFSGAIIEIYDYATTTRIPTTRSLAGIAGSGASTNLRFVSGHFRSENPVTSLSLTDTQGFNFLQNSRFSLYGIRG